MDSGYLLFSQSRPGASQACSRLSAQEPACLFWSLWAAVEPPCPLLADASRALSCLQGRPPFLCQAGLVYQSTHQDLPQKYVWDFLGAQRGGF